MKSNDWRIRDQEDYLMGVSLNHKKFKSTLPKILKPGDDIYKYNDHEHCIFCWHKFMENCKNMEDCSTDGYCTPDGRTWICENCYEDFKELFKWTLVEALADAEKGSSANALTGK